MNRLFIILVLLITLTACSSPIDEIKDYLRDYKVNFKSFRIKFKEVLQDKKELLKVAFPKMDLGNKEIKR